MKTNRVLLIEDDVTIAHLLTEGLRSIDPGMEVQVLASGHEALSQIEPGRWDLVVTEVQVSGASCAELLERLRASMPATPSILITPLGYEPAEPMAKPHDLCQYIGKPFQLADLSQIVRKALQSDRKGHGEPAVKIRRPGSHPAIKVILGGDGNVGKTTMIHRMNTGRFEARRSVTVGVEFHIHDVALGESLTRLIVWDLGGQDRFAFTRKAFYLGSKAVGLVYDASERQSFDRLPTWRKEVRELLPHVPIVMVGNKIDLPRQVNPEEGKALADAWGVAFFETDCTSGQGVRDFFDALADAAVRHRMQLADADGSLA